MQILAFKNKCKKRLRHWRKLKLCSKMSTTTAMPENLSVYAHRYKSTNSNNMGGSKASKEWLVGAKSKHSSKKFEDCHTPPLLHHRDTAIVDSYCTGHFLFINAHFRSKTKYVTPLRVILPNGDTMGSTHTASLDIKKLSDAASLAHVLPAMASNSLLSVVQLYNEGYYVTFKIDGVAIFSHGGKSILKGHRILGKGLRRINLHKDGPQT
jgi:hypothetical protein